MCPAGSQADKHNMNVLSIFHSRLVLGFCTTMMLVSFQAFAVDDTFVIDGTVVSLDYLINGEADPDLVLVRGKTYVFQLSTPGHPFCVKTAPTLGKSNDRYDTGVTNNCIETGTLTFVVPLDAPDELFYICSVHISMTASIIIVDDLPLFSDGFES